MLHVNKQELTLVITILYIYNVSHVQYPRCLPFKRKQFAISCLFYLFLVSYRNRAYLEPF